MDRLVVGSGSDVDVWLDDDFVSSRHALVIRYRDSNFASAVWRVWVSDLGSTIGTWVNGRRIHEPTELHPGDFLCFGRTERMMPQELWASRR